MTKADARFFIKSYGCQMNVYDSQRMADALSPSGLSQTDKMEDAGVIILNTCHIREKAAEKVYSELGRIRQLREKRAENGQSTHIVVSGCVAQAEGKEIIRRAPTVDLVVGPQSYHQLPELIEKLNRGERKLVETEFPVEDKFGFLPNGEEAAPPASFLTVQEGCDKFCTFCVVPYTRGAEFSRPVDQIVAEAENLVARGSREITLLGQNVNAYHGAGPNGNDWGLPKLLEELGKIEKLERLRFTTSHPRDMDDELIEAFAKQPKLMPYLHLPFQAGSDKILEKMNRQHTGEFYLNIIERLREACPDIALSTDIIVGFPGETDEDFEATMEMVRKVGYTHAYSFKYSMRPGTPAAEQDEQVPEVVKSERLQRLQALIEEQQAAYNATFVGREMSILLDRPGHEKNQLIGRSPYMQSVHVSSPDIKQGASYNVRITEAGRHSLSGEII